MAKKINTEWRNRIVGSGTMAAGQFVANPSNWRIHPKAQRDALNGVLNEVGWVQNVIVNKITGNVVDGHARIEEALKRGDDTPVPYVEVELTEDEEQKILLALDPISAMAAADKAQLDALLKSVETQDAAVMAMIADMADKAGLDYGDSKPLADAEPQIDKAEELRVKWGVELGQLWQLGDHRLLCGDSTRAEDVARVMGGEKAELLHADPPYGMGKEKDGVENDNLYAAKLDAFQMLWWRAFRPSLADNGSAYIWGNAEDLWRLWYVGGLKNSERLTLRNEIVWDKVNQSGKYDGNGIGSSIGRQYASISERCLFFMLGEQGFNNNADNYWEGWEAIRTYLKEEIQKVNWSEKDIKQICGVGMYSHWFTKSQWTFIPEEHYRKLQAATKGDAFKRDYDELKREYDELKRDFYATRAYFNNTHDNMTDVWSFGRVTGDERHGHATPKPVKMIARAIMSSSPDNGTVAEPFSGSGTTLIACEQLNRKCRAIEISPAYVAVALQRWADATGKTPMLMTD